MAFDLKKITIRQFIQHDVSIADLIGRAILFIKYHRLKTECFEKMFCRLIIGDCEFDLLPFEDAAARFSTGTFESQPCFSILPKAENPKAVPKFTVWTVEAKVGFMNTRLNQTRLQILKAQFDPSQIAHMEFCFDLLVVHRSSVRLIRSVFVPRSRRI